MVEKESPERRVRQSPERKVRVLEQTTFAKAGIETANDRLNLASDNITLATVEGLKSGTSINIVFDHHPFAGEHFAQLLGSIAPFGTGGRFGILADLDMPVNAKGELERGVEESNNIRLHLRHLEDPKIGPPYKRFVDQNLESWLTALKNDASLEVFQELQRVTFIESLQKFTPHVFQEWKEEPSKYASRLISTARRFYKEGARFMSFLKNNVRLREGDRDEEWAFYCLPIEQAVKMLHEFLEQLNGEEKEEFALAYVVGKEGRVLMDLNNKQVSRSTKYDGIISTKTKVDVVEEEYVRIKDDEGTSVVAMAHKHIGGGRYDWKATHYEFSPQYLATSLYPTIAWERNEDGQRRFLTQEEAKPYLRQLGLPEARRGDVKVGEIMPAYFSPNIIGNWQKTIPLKPPPEDNRLNFNQRMMGAQMPVWVSLRDHSQELFAEKDGLFDRLEQRMATAA